MFKTEKQNKTKNPDKKKITAFQLFASELNSESAVKEKKREREMLRKLGKDAAHLIATLASEILANLLGFFYLKKLKEVHYAL